ncbi:MAG: ABC transporter permease [Mangrovibacterium sp.]
MLGLSVGLLVSLMLLFYIHFETSFESFNPNADKIYRIVEQNIQDGTTGAQTPLALRDVLKKDYPEIDQVVGLMRTWEDLQTEEEKFRDLKGAIVEPEFFGLFQIPLLQGTLFRNPYEAIITAGLAGKLFGDDDPLGRTFEFEGHPFTITAVVDKIPPNSVLDFDYFLSDPFRYRYYPDLNQRWYEFGLYTFITFKGNEPTASFEQKLTNIEKQYYPDFMKNRHHYRLTAFRGSHLDPSIEGDLVPAVNPVYLWILAAIAIGILVIACLNFVNISIANAGKRNIETGIKKINGATSSALIAGFFLEISVILLISLGVAFAGVYLLMPSFNELTGKDVAINFSDSLIWGGIAGFGLLTALIAGLYPAIVLSKPSPLKILQQNRMAGRNKMTFQKGFVIFQFVITIILGIAQLFIFRQISFMRGHDTGFDKNNLIVMPAGALGQNRAEKLKNTALFTGALENHRAQYGYSSASVTEFIPGFGFRNNFKIYPAGGVFPDGIELLSCDVDENFREVFGMRMIQGRFFSNDFSTDMESAVLINEAALRKLGWDSAEGKEVGLISKDNRKRVIGVINDINVASLQYPVKPLIYQFGPHHNYPGYIAVRLHPEKEAESIGFLKRTWEKLFPDIPFEFESVSEKYKAAYGEEERLAKITGIFSMLAMVLSALGIFALSTLQPEKRIKEIGIRKVNGAKIPEILAMLNQDFLKWIAVAFVIAVPVAWYAMNKWLGNFAYKTNLSWWIFALAGLLALGIALLTVSWQSWKAATRNPVEALRYE